MMTGSRVTLGLPRSAVLYCALLALSCVTAVHGAGWAGGHVAVNVKVYFSRPNIAFIRNNGYFVSLDNAEDCCRERGAFLPADQSRVAHESIQDVVKDAMFGGVAVGYLGGDALFSGSRLTPISSKCIPGNIATSRHCVYRWNKGLFASASADGQGVPFWRGSFRRQGDAFSLNGYPSFWGAEYPKRGELYTLVWYRVDDAISAWYDGKEASGTASWRSENPETENKNYIIVCEVHDSISRTISATEDTSGQVTSGPTATAAAEVEASPSSFWTLRDWRSILLVSLLLGAVVVLLLVVVCRCCSSGDGAKETSPMTLREIVGEPISAVIPYEGLQEAVVPFQYNN